MIFQKIKSMEKPKILIVGAGLAGICLARQLYKRNIEFQVVDSGINESSVIAAGQINPLVFRRMTKSWRIDEFLPYSKAFFTTLGEEWGQQFYVDIPIRRAFAHQQEKDFWLKKQEEEAFQPYMFPFEPENQSFSILNNTYGTAVVRNSAFVHAKRFVEAAHTWLKKENRLRTENFDYTKLNVEESTYQGDKFSQLVFCQGYKSKDNPFFSYLPVESTKGEVLTVKSTEFQTNEALNRKCFILPVEESIFKIGATYVWDAPNTVITKEAREDLLEKARSLVDVSFEVLSQEAGVRPTILDRRPILGKHPMYNNLNVFNGLGTKGYLLAPLLAEEFTDFLLENKTLNPEVNATRFAKNYAKLLAENI
jgi:glycine oxidase